eukprot:474498_1
MLPFFEKVYENITDHMTDNMYLNLTIIGMIVLIVLVVMVLTIWYCIKKCKQNSNDKSIDRLATEYDTETDVELNYNIYYIKQSLVAVLDTEFITINIQTSNGLIQQLEPCNTDTISILKQDIEKRFQIPKSKQEIRFNGKVCNSDHQIAQCGIKTGDTVHVIEINDIKKEIKVSLKYKQKTYTIVCSNLMTIKDFKETALAMIPKVDMKQQLLTYQGTELVDQNMLLKQYGINQDCVVEFELKKHSQSP